MATYTVAFPTKPALAPIEVDADDPYGVPEAIARHLGFTRFDVLMHDHGGLIGPSDDPRRTINFTLTEKPAVA